MSVHGGVPAPRGWSSLGVPAAGGCLLLGGCACSWEGVPAPGGLVPGGVPASGRVPAPGGIWSRGVPAPGGWSGPRGCLVPSGILLECILVINCVFEIPQVPFVFEFESEWSNGNSVTKQSPNYYSTIQTQTVLSPNYYLVVQLTFPNWPNCNSVMLLNCHSTVQTRTQTQTEPEAYRMHDKFKNIVCETSQL